MNIDENKNKDLSPEKILEEKNIDRSKFFLNGKPKKSSKVGEPEKIATVNEIPKTANQAGQQSQNQTNQSAEPLKIPYGLFSGFIFLLLKFLNILAKFLNYELIEDQNMINEKVKEADRAYTDFLNYNKKQVSNSFKIFLAICSMFTSIVTLFRKKEPKQVVKPISNLSVVKENPDAKV